MFQYAALERNNTTEPLGGRQKKKKHVSSTSRRCSKPQPPHRPPKPAEIQLPDCCRPLSICSGAHLAPGEDLVQTYTCTSKVLFISVLGTVRGAEITGEGRQQTLLPPRHSPHFTFKALQTFQLVTYVFSTDTGFSPKKTL